MSAIIRAAFDYRRQVREQFQDLLEAQYAAAVHDCNTVLLNAGGREARVDPFSLLYGPGARLGRHLRRRSLAAPGPEGLAARRTTYRYAPMPEPGRAAVISDEVPSGTSTTVRTH